MIMSKILLIILLFSASASANKKIGCTQPNLCQLLKSILKDSNTTLKPVLTISGDPHHFSPAPHHIKNMVKVDLLIAAPVQLQPWIEQVSAKRPDQTTFVWNLQNDIKPQIVQKYGPHYHELSHFWLYPEMQCQLEEKLKGFFKQNKVVLRPHTCDEDNYRSRLEELAKKMKNYMVIPTHSAISPLLNAHGIKTLALRGAHHHSQIQASQLKKLETLRQTYKTIWLTEGQLAHGKETFRKFKRKDDLHVELVHERPNPLDYFLDNLEKIIP